MVYAVKDIFKQIYSIELDTNLYNKATGANLTHWELSDLGIMEEARIMAAIRLWDI